MPVGYCTLPVDKVHRASQNNRTLFAKNFQYFGIIPTYMATDILNMSTKKCDAIG